MANLLQSGWPPPSGCSSLLDAERQSPDPEPAATVEHLRGRVAFEHVRFGYDERPLLRDLSLVAEPGQTVAVVGPTGAGKTTLVNLLMRFHELQGGRITLDGVDVATMRRDDLRSRVGMVLQDAWVFDGSIRDNIAYGRPSATEAEVLRAAEAAYVDRFVHGLPDGYDTLVGTDGGDLSAGERRSRSLARSSPTRRCWCSTRPPGSVDTRTEVLVQEAMAALRSDRTSFVIAHRLSTIRDADLILVMDAGEIVEQGTHAEPARRRRPLPRACTTRSSPRRPPTRPVSTSRARRQPVPCDTRPVARDPEIERLRLEVVQSFRLLRAAPRLTPQAMALLEARGELEPLIDLRGPDDDGVLTLQGRVLRMRHRFEPGDDAAARLDAAVREVAEHARQRGAGSLELRAVVEGRPRWTHRVLRRGGWRAQQRRTAPTSGGCAWCSREHRGSALEHLAERRPVE
nr:ATP-binding cassette domain-containing protein [Angustibacter aerolatus]